MKLTLPFNKSMMLCGYKVNPYKEHWGYPHYGIDISAKEANGNMYVLASGDGVVLASAKDNTLGGGIAILYKDCESRYGERVDIIARYMHLSALNVEKGDVVKRGQVIGYEGKEGTESEHLHLEFDTDTLYPTYSPQVSNNHTFWMKGIDKTVNPSLWLWCGEDQELVTPTYNPAWLNAEDFDIPRIGKDINVPGKEEDKMAEYEKLPINEEVPLNVVIIEDGEEIEVKAYGEQKWALVKRPEHAYGYITYDKYMRRVPSWWSDACGEFVKEEDWDKLVPISEVDPQYLKDRDGYSEPTDTNNYDYLFDIEQPEEKPDVPENTEPTPSPVPGPSVEVSATVAAAICRVIADAFSKIAVILDGDRE